MTPQYQLRDTKRREETLYVTGIEEQKEKRHALNFIVT